MYGPWRAQKGAASIDILGVPELFGARPNDVGARRPHRQGWGPDPRLSRASSSGR